VRIGVDATCWANSRGYGRFARELVRSMIELGTDDEFLCYGDAHAFSAWPAPSGPRVTLIDVPMRESPTAAATSTSRRSVRDMFRLTRAVGRDRPDVVFFPATYTYFPIPPGVPGVVTVHDTIPERFPHLTLPSASARLFWHLKTRLALWQCRVVLTVSDHAARSIVAVMQVPRERIRVTTEAPAQAYRPTPEEAQASAAVRAGVPERTPWFVYVGGFNPHKRVDTILRAHAAVAGACDPAPHLLLVGARSEAFHGETTKLDAIVRNLGTGPLVHWLGFVPDEALVPLVGGARALVLPSEAEGFGLPAVEAAACGTPVIATRESPLPELLEGAGCFVNPGDDVAIERGMHEMLDPERRTAYAAVARQRAAVMSWETAARIALDAIREAAS